MKGIRIIRSRVAVAITMIVMLASVKLIAQEVNIQRPSGEYPYLEYLPTTYSETGEKFPVIVFLHGSGEKGSGSDTDIQKVAKHGPFKHINSGADMCYTVNGKEECFVVIGPQTSGTFKSEDVQSFLNYILDTYNVDPSRLYLTGLSLGGQCAYNFAGSSYNSDNMIAALGIMSATASCQVAQNIGALNIPVWHHHGDKDATTHSYAKAQSTITCINKQSPDPAPIFTVYEGVGHSAWNQGYLTDNSLHSPNLYEWFLMQKLGEATSVNQSPTVDAGSDQELVLPENSISFTASAEDSDGTISSYEWTKTSGPSVTMDNTSTATLDVSDAVEGDYTFTLTVTDDEGASASDEVTLSVIADSSDDDGSDDPDDAVVADQIIIDNDDASCTMTGSWSTSTAGGDSKYGDNYYHDNNTGDGAKSLTYTANLASGVYEVFGWWFAYSNRASNVPVEVTGIDGSSTVYVDQTESDATWVSLGVFNFDGSSTITISNEGTDGYVVADAIKIVTVSLTSNVSVPADNDTVIVDNADDGFSYEGSWSVSTAGGSSKYGDDYYHDDKSGDGNNYATFTTDLGAGYYEVYGWWFAYSNRSSDTPVDIEHSEGTTTVSVNQQEDDGQWVSMGVYYFDGESAVTFYNEGTEGYVVADAVKFVPTSSTTASARSTSEKSEESNPFFTKNIELNLYPNPVQSSLNVVVNDVENEVVRMALYNGLGKVLWSDKVTSTSSTLEVEKDVEDLEEGIYYFKVSTSNGKSLTKRIQKSIY